jgi:hypothetical protein
MRVVPLVVPTIVSAARPPKKVDGYAAAAQATPHGNPIRAQARRFVRSGFSRWSDAARAAGKADQAPGSSDACVRLWAQPVSFSTRCRDVRESR